MFSQSIKSLCMASCTLVLAACGAQQQCLTEGGDSSQSVGPLSNAGENQIVAVGSNVLLNAENSDASDSSPINFEWTLTQKPGFSLGSILKPFLANPSFTADKAGDYCARLTVFDGASSTATDFVKIQAVTGNIAPVAIAGKDINVSSVNVVALDGSSSFDNNGDNLSYTWVITTRPINSNAAITDPNTSKPTIVVDKEGTYTVDLTVNDGTVDSTTDSVQIIYTSNNLPPIANAGEDQNIEENGFTITAEQSSDPEGQNLNYKWQLISRPKDSKLELSVEDQVSLSLEADTEGSYLFELLVTDTMGNVSRDRTLVNFNDLTSGVIFEDFDRDGDLIGVVTNNSAALPDVKSSLGRYRAYLSNNDNNKTLHYNAQQGRLDAWKTRFPFEMIARNIGIGSPNNSQTPHSYSTGAFNFAGVQVHSLELDSPNSAHVVVGHRGNTAPFTIEGKNTVNGSSSVDDIGSYTVREAKADLRIVGDENGALTVYWQQPNMAENKEVSDNWVLYRGAGKLPGNQVNFGRSGSEVYVGLITYAYNSTGIPFIGTCDSVKIIEN